MVIIYIIYMVHIIIMYMVYSSPCGKFEKIIKKIKLINSKTDANANIPHPDGEHYHYFAGMVKKNG